MITGIEKSLKRYLKRKVKITVGIVVAFLLSCNLVSADNSILEITEENGNILFNGKIFDEENHEFLGNTFKDNVYVNNNIMLKEAENKNVIGIDINTNENFLFINKNFISSFTKYSINTESPFSFGIYIQKKIDKIENKGYIISKAENNYFQNGENEGIYTEGDVNEINNNGIIMSKFSGENKGWMYYNNGISIYSNVEKLENEGLILSVLENSMNNVASGGISIGIEYGNVDKIINTGIVHTKGNETGTIWSNGTVNLLQNNGTISAYNDFEGGINDITAVYFDPPEDIKRPVTNNGKILSLNLVGSASSLNGKFETIQNSGLVFSNGKNTSNAIYMYSTISFIYGNVNNLGTIISKSEIEDSVGIDYYEKIENYGVISADIPMDIYYIDKAANKGLLINEVGENLVYNSTSKKFEIQQQNEQTISSTDVSNTSGKTIINAGSNADGKVLSINSDTIKGLSDEGYILNGFNDVVIIDDNTGNKNINNSIINGVQTAVLIKDGKTLSLDNTTVNGGYNFDIIKGEGANNLNISGTSTINGNVNLGDGKDTLSVTDTVQLNGILNGGEGTEDTLTFNKSSVPENNINLLYDIQGFEKTTINTDVTLFEKTVNNTGDLTSLKAQMGDIVIADGAKLTLRIDGTEKVNDKITGHALYRNNGSLTTEEKGKLLLGVYGAGTEMIINFGGTDISNLNSDNVDTTSILHNIAVKDNDIIISAEKDLKDIELENYDKLNNIYHSIYNSQNIDKFTVSEEQYNSFLKYLHDIYAVNPYAFSSELSRKTMGMMRNLADKDLKPELKKWAVYGGLTHIDGGTEESYYGKGYYGYDIGSRDIKADTKITGGYFKAEYGKSDSVTTGLIFGGNNSETEIGASKVEGDSFYFGAYAKKYLNDFRFTLGAGFQHGDYKGDRTAIGYEGVTETRKYSENYHDRGFDIYGNLKYSKDLGNNFFFEPAFTLSYTYLDQDGVEESGILGIDTDSQNFDYVSGELNLDVRKIFAGTVNLHSITAGFSYERMISGYDKEYITGRFAGGTNFDILVPEKEKDIFSLNAKYEFEKENGFIFDVKGQYKFEHDNNQEEWIIGTGIGYRF